MSNDTSKAARQAPVFRFLDRRADIEKTSRNLPHWFQVGAAIFVTFRTADSMPREVVLRFQQELEHWLKLQNLPLELAQPPGQETTNAATNSEADANGENCGYFVCDASVPQIPPRQLAEFKKLRARAWHRSLDQCHGDCLLNQPRLARIVAESLLYHNNNHYDLDRFVIMPNHVHAIVQFRPGGSLETISQTWLRYTARQINFETGEKGSLWQPEPFDHIIRNENQFAYLQNYVADNPDKANLKNGQYLYWQSDLTT